MIELGAIGLYKQNRQGVCTVAETSRRRSGFKGNKQLFWQRGFSSDVLTGLRHSRIFPWECGLMKQPELPALRGDDFQFELSDM
jgi:hypothetical protein